MTGCGGTYTILHIYKNYRTACQRVNFKIQIRKQTEKKENKQQLTVLLKTMRKEEKNEERLKGDLQA